MSQSTIDHRSERRKVAWRMFYILGAGVVFLVLALILAAIFLQNSEGGDLIKGIVFTAIAGAITSVLSFMGIIVKGIMDNLTQDQSSQ